MDAHQQMAPVILSDQMSVEEALTALSDVKVGLIASEDTAQSLVVPSDLQALIAGGYATLSEANADFPRLLAFRGAMTVREVLARLPDAEREDSARRGVAEFDERGVIQGLWRVPIEVPLEEWQLGEPLQSMTAKVRSVRPIHLPFATHHLLTWQDANLPGPIDVDYWCESCQFSLSDGSRCGQRLCFHDQADAETTKCTNTKVPAHFFESRV